MSVQMSIQLLIQICINTLLSDGNTDGVARVHTNNDCRCPFLYSIADEGTGDCTDVHL